jgi:hypothetical protein
MGGTSWRKAEIEQKDAEKDCQREMVECRPLRDSVTHAIRDQSDTGQQRPVRRVVRFMHRVKFLGFANKTVISVLYTRVVG